MPALISLETILVGWAAALALTWRSGRERMARRLMLVVFAGAIVVSTPIVPHTASLMFGRSYDRLEHGDPRLPIAAIVVLGAGTEIVEAGGRRLALLDSVGARRVLEAARAYHLLGSPWVISSGGARRQPRECSSARVMANALIELGVDPARILLEDASLTTRDEAVLVAPMLARANAHRFLLVTTRSHMRRAVGAFRRVGLDPVPSTAADELGRAPWRDLLTPGVTGLRLSHALLHEVLGVAYYRWRGWLA